MTFITLSNAFFLTTFLSSIYPTYYYISTNTLPYYKLLNNLYNNKQQLNYNYYVYSIQKWCDNGYQIHGLWPQYDKNSYPTYCEAPVYQNVEGELYNEMYKEWNNCGDLQSFWNHEYTKHLSCIYQQYGMTEEESFQLTLNLFNEFTKEDFDKCNNADDCIIGCFDLNLNRMNCP